MQLNVRNLTRTGSRVIFLADLHFENLFAFHFFFFFLVFQNGYAYGILALKFKKLVCFPQTYIEMIFSTSSSFFLCFVNCDTDN